jgi:hypothetical protein
MVVSWPVEAHILGVLGLLRPRHACRRDGKLQISPFHGYTTESRKSVNGTGAYNAVTVREERLTTAKSIRASNFTHHGITMFEQEAAA